MTHITQKDSLCLRIKLQIALIFQTLMEVYNITQLQSDYYNFSHLIKNCETNTGVFTCCRCFYNDQVIFITLLQQRSFLSISLKFFTLSSLPHSLQKPIMMYSLLLILLTIPRIRKVPGDALDTSSHVTRGQSLHMARHRATSRLHARGDKAVAGSRSCQASIFKNLILIKIIPKIIHAN